MAAAYVRGSILPALLALFAVSASAQTGPATRAISSQPPDSAEVVARARAAQAAFERARFRLLPRTYATPHGPCDERIGRYCFWFESGDKSWRPPPEPEAVRPHLDRLLGVLDQAAAQVPGDGWVAGQRVRYLVHARHPDRALAAARECRAERWWCAALKGFALHEGERFAEAEEAFREALAAMPERTRKEWTDVEPILRRPQYAELERAAGEERAAAERRMWWLADPLWSEPGNDRLTEHYVRWVHHHLQDHARQTDVGTWSRDNRTILLRYGWPVAAMRRDPTYGSMLSSFLVEYHDPVSWEFLPPAAAARAPAAITGREWTMKDEPSATRYAPAYAHDFVDVRHQLAVFRRGDSAVVVAGFRLRADSLPARPRVRAALVAMEDADATPFMARAEVADSAGAMRVLVPHRPTVLSLEVREDSSRVHGRHRQGLALAADARSSDVLLLSDPAARPGSLDEAARLARGDTHVRPGERLGIFWEVYGLEAGTDTLGVGVSLVPGTASWGRRRLERIGLARAARAVRMSWQEEAQGGAVVARSLGVALPPTLPPGTYTLEVTVQIPGRPPVTASRIITVER